jgi:hypothetical protein
MSVTEGDIDLQGFLDLDRSLRKGLQGIPVNFKIKANVRTKSYGAFASWVPDTPPYKTC